MKPLYFTAGLLLCITSANAEPVFAIDPQIYGMQKPFGPPSPITPKDVLTAPPENQFDRANRHYLSVADEVNERMDTPWHFTFGQYQRSNYSGALFRKREANYYVLASAAYVDANKYASGNNGGDVDYGYERDSEAIVLGILPNTLNEHRLTLVHDNIRDDKQPQNQMDAVKTRRVIGKYNGRFGQEDGSNTFYTELSGINLKRKANNFDLRTVTSSPKVNMEVDRERYTGDIYYRYQFSDTQQSSVGVRYQSDLHNAKRYVNTAAGRKVNGLRFANVKTKSTRLYASHEWQPDDKQSLKGALSYDWQTADAQDANKALGVASLPTPSQLWQAHYGRAYDGDIEQNGLSGKLRYTYDLTNKQSFYGQLESLYRMPDNIERFSALPGPAGSAWASNPWVNPERENRLTLGTQFSGNGWRDYQSTQDDDFSGAWQVGAEVYYAHVNDFITLDRYRGSNPNLAGNVISDNVSARLAGTSISFAKNWNHNISTKLSLAYNYGDNRSDDRPLYQVAPFETNLNIDWKDYFDSGSYNLGAQIRYVNKQTRMDDNVTTGLGIDNSTGSFATLDLYSGIQWKNSIGISAGIDNVFDRRYAEYITGDHVEALAPGIVDAPGRFYWIRVSAAF